MIFIIATGFWILGLILTSFTLLPILIILVFGIPTTNKLTRKSLLKPDNGIIKRYLTSITILFVIFVGTVVIILWLIPNGIIGFGIGTVLTLIFGVSKLGKNVNNVSDYLEVNERHFTKNLEEVSIAIMLS